MLLVSVGSLTVINFIPSFYPYSNTVSGISDTEQEALYFEASRYGYISYKSAP